jgi:hypothetical protein
LQNRIAIVAALLSISCTASERPSAAESATASEEAAHRSTVSDAGIPRSCSDHTIRGESVGAITVGEPVDSLNRCPIVRDTIVPGGEGTTARKVFIALANDTIAAEIVDGSVWRIEVSSPGVRTADSLGVGTPLARLLALSNPRGVSGEGQMFVLSPDHCGQSFEISHFGPMPAGGWTRTALSKLPDTTHVISVLVVRCHPELF